WGLAVSGSAAVVVVDATAKGGRHEEERIRTFRRARARRCDYECRRGGDRDLRRRRAAVDDSIVLLNALMGKTIFPKLVSTATWDPGSKRVYEMTSAVISGDSASGGGGQIFRPHARVGSSLPIAGLPAATAGRRRPGLPEAQRRHAPRRAHARCGSPRTSAA